MARTITIEFLGNSRQLQEATDDAQSRMSQFGERMSGIGKKIALGLGVGLVGAAAGLVELTKGAVEDAAAQARLAKALQNTAGATDAQVASVEEWISAQGTALGFADDELRPALEKLATATGDVGEAQKLAAQAMDISAGSGKSLESVATALAKAQNGNVASLGKLGISVKDAAGETVSLEEAQRRLAKAFEGQASTRAETLTGKMDRLKIVVAEAGEAIGERMIPVAAAIADWIVNTGVPAFDAFSGKVADLTGKFSEIMQLVGRKLQPVFDKVGEFVRENPQFVKAFAIAVGVLAGAFAGLALATAAFSLALQTTGIPLLIIGIAALVAGLVVAYKRSEEFRAVVQRIGNGIKEFGRFVYENAKPAIEALVELFFAVKEKVPPIVQGFVDVVLGIWDKFGGILTDYAKGAFKALKSIIKGAFQVIRGIFKVFSNLLKGNWKGVWDGIKDIIKGAFKIVWGIIRQGWNVIKTGFRAGGTAIREAVSGAFGKIKDLAKSGIEFVWEKIKDLPGLIRDLGPKMLDAGKALIGKFFDGLKALGGIAKSVAGNLMNAIIDGINAGINAVNDFLPDSLDLPGPLGSINLPDNPFPTIPGFAKGTNFAPGGVALVGEQGPELVELPRGSRVRTAAQTAAMAGGLGTGGMVVNINGPVYGNPRDFARHVIAELRKEKRLTGTDLGLA